MGFGVQNITMNIDVCLIVVDLFPSLLIGSDY